MCCYPAFHLPCCALFFFVVVSEGIIRRYSVCMKALLPGILRITRKDERALGVMNVLKKFSIFLRCAQIEF